jgi:hypothetical protein
MFNIGGGETILDDGGDVGCVGEKTRGAGAKGGGERTRGGGEKTRWGRTGEGEFGREDIAQSEIPSLCSSDAQCNTTPTTTTPPDFNAGSNASVDGCLFYSSTDYSKEVWKLF